MTSVKPPAFQVTSNMKLGTTMALVALVHVVIIVLVLSHFGWLGGAEPDTEAGAGSSGIVIPVTLETTESTSAVAPDVAPAPEPVLKPAPEPALEPSPEPPSESAPEPMPEVPSESAPEPMPEVPVSTQSTPTTSHIPPTSSEQNKARTAPSQPAQRHQPPQDSSPASSLSTGTTQASITNATDNASVFIPAQIDPNYLHRPNPTYPALSKQRRETGTVLLRVSLDAKGIVQDISVQTSSDFQRLDQAALEAVRQWRFIPALRGAQPVPASVLVPIEFRHP